VKRGFWPAPGLLTRPAWRYHVPPNLEAQYQRTEDGCQGKFCGKAQNVEAQCPKHLDVVVAFQTGRGLIVTYFRALRIVLSSRLPFTFKVLKT
jgi:hypothetical protein